MKNRLYDYILKFQGVRHMIANPEGLENCERYLDEFFSELGIRLERQNFEIPGYDKPGRNLVAHMGTNPELPVILLGAHYDTTPIAQGAEDDGSGMAIMLECARYFAPLRDKVNLVFAFFDLEEAENPAVAKVRREAGLELGIFDEDYIYSKLEYMDIENSLMPMFVSGEPLGESCRRAVDNSGAAGMMREYLERIAEAMSGFVKPNGFGENSLLGSFNWVESNPDVISNLAGAIIYDEVGVASDVPHSGQISDTSLFEIAELNGVDPAADIGNYIVMVSNSAASALADTVKQSAKSEGLPYAGFAPDMDYVSMLKSPIRYLLFADNAPFWEKDIPTVFFTDTGHGMRGKYGHTRADTVEHMNFDFLAKLTRTTIDTIERFYGI